MDEDETIEERQTNELLAMKAIFMEQCKDCNEESETWKPLNLILTLFPPENHCQAPEARVQLDLHVVANENYPNEEPKIMLENSRGLSRKDVNKMQDALEQIATNLKGEVMVFELAKYVQHCLTDLNKPEFESFYDEMLSLQQEKKQKEVQLKKADEDIERQLIALEVQGLKKERRRSKKKAGFSEQNTVASLEIQKIGSKVTNTTKGANLARDTTIVNKTKPDVPTNNRTNMGVVKRDNSLNADKSFHTINHNSRIQKEFEMLDFVGHGAFGDVIKVRNKLDDCLYAIKRIHLNSKNKQLNKKIVREVKLLSKLNHENIVRYYNSWLEEACDDDTETPCSEPIKVSDRPQVKLKENLSLSFSKPNFSDDDEEDDEDEDSGSGWITFVRGSGGSDSSETVVDGGDDNTSQQLVQNLDDFNQYLYIQMEYCEKSTLRSAIDNDLYKDEKRVWRLLREIVEGLAYIHQQGIIHRDLKPVNIFIDFEDHVKIGDFGLATPNKHIAAAVKTELSAPGKVNNGDVQNGTSETTSHTGQVGTTLYVAPELSNASFTLLYNQKVDIYSLGIIFFEMCYMPLNTEMERIRVLTNLRQYSRNLPTDFLRPEHARQIKLIRDLLNHNPKERPSAKEILKNANYIPSVDVEDNQFFDAVRFTLSNPQSKSYKWLISECFSQTVSSAEDITFDNVSHGKLIWQYSAIEKLATMAKKIFRLHGGTYLSTRLLAPDSNIVSAEGIVTLMTKHGSLVNIPYDPKLSFARYLAQNPSVLYLKRYTVDKVYRERRMLGEHPREIFECSFDIVSPFSNNLTAEAELISVTCELLKQLPDTYPKDCILQLNHTSLVTGVLLYHRIQIEKHAAFCDWFSKTKNNPSDGVTFTCNDVQRNVLEKVIGLMEEEFTCNKLPLQLSDILKKQNASSSYCRQALKQLENLTELLEYFGIQCPIVVAPHLVTDLQHFSGVIFQIVRYQKDKKSRMKKDVIVSGGRYDRLVSLYRKRLNVTIETCQSVVGLVVHLDRLANLLGSNLNTAATVDVLVCSIGKTDMIQNKLKIAKELWAAGIRSAVLYEDQTFEETQNYCKEMNVPFVVFVKESETGLIGVISWSKDRLCEKKLQLSELVAYIQKNMKSVNAEGSYTTAGSGNVSTSTNTYHPGSPHHSARLESRSSSVSDNHLVNITFLAEEKLASNNKRRYESQILNAISNSVKRLSQRFKIEVLAVNVEPELIHSLSASVELNSKNFDISQLLKRFPRQKKILNKISDAVEELLARETIPTIVFFSLAENTFRIVI